MNIIPSILPIHDIPALKMLVKDESGNYVTQSVTGEIVKVDTIEEANDWFIKKLYKTCIELDSMSVQTESNDIFVRSYIGKLRNTIAARTLRGSANTIIVCPTLLRIFSKEADATMEWVEVGEYLNAKLFTGPVPYSTIIVSYVDENHMFNNCLFNTDTMEITTHNFNNFHMMVRLT